MQFRWSNNNCPGKAIQAVSIWTGNAFGGRGFLVEGKVAVG